MITPEEYDKKKNAQRLREGLENHIRFVAGKTLEKYGDIDSLEVLRKLLEDREIVRFGTKLIFDSEQLPEGGAAGLQPLGDEPGEGYFICLHPVFEEREEDIIALALYTIPKINYGKIAKEREAELFGSILLGIEQAEYRDRVERLRSEVL